MKQENAKRTILAMEKGALDRWSSGDPVGYVESATGDFTYFDDIGAQNRISGAGNVREYLASLQTQIPEHSYRMVDPKVQIYGEVGIATFRYDPSSVDGEALPAWKATSVYCRVGTEWQMVHANWSMIKEEG